jgi:ABC-type glycerol-3-phosphate transport system permease component
MVSARFESAPSSSAGATTVIAASGFLSALPAVLLAVVFQRYMVQGLTTGSVKG